MIHPLSNYQPFGLSYALIQSFTCERPHSWQETARTIIRIAIRCFGIVCAAALDLCLLPIYLISRCHLPHPPTPQPAPNPPSPPAAPPPPSIPLPTPEETAQILNRPQSTPQFFLRDAIQTALARFDEPKKQEYLELLRNHGVFTQTEENPGVEIFTWSAACAICHALVQQHALRRQYHQRIHLPEFFSPQFARLSPLFFSLWDDEKAFILRSIEMSRPLPQASSRLRNMMEAIQREAYAMTQTPAFRANYLSLYPIF